MIVKAEPKVVIIGSANVGKSTLFNRLLGVGRSITDSAPGVTRDPVEQTCAIGDLSFTLVDTGGYEVDKSEDLSRIVSEKGLCYAENADLVLFVVDITGISLNDQAYADKLRPMRDKIVLVVNKVDNNKRENDIWNLYEMGFEKIIGVSAAHGRNIPSLKDVIVSHISGLKSDHKSEDPSGIRIAVLGKPNTGKSTLMNWLVGEEKSIVHAKPGTTRDVIEGQFHFEGTDFRVLDTAGIRRKSKISDNIEHYSVSRALQSIRRSDVVFLMIDSQEGLSDQDKKIASVIVHEGKGIILVLNKWDLFEKMPNRLEAVRDRIGFVFPVLSFAPVLPLSAISGQGVSELLKTTQTVVSQLERRVGTGPLNQAVQAWISEHAIPSRGKNIKIRYTVQASASPVIFIFFGNRPKAISRSYRNYLMNKIRSEFGFTHVPIRIDFKES